MMSTRDLRLLQGHTRLKVKEWKKMFYINGNQKKAGEATFISDKIYFTPKTVTRDNEDHYIMIKGSVH